MANRDVKLTIRAKDDASAVIKKVTEALAKYGTGQDDVSRKLAPISDKFRRMTDEVTGLQKAMGRAKGQVALTEQFNILNAALAKAADQHRQSTEALVTHSAALKTNKESLETVMTARTKVREALSEEKKDLNSATAAIERHTAGMKAADLAIKKYGKQISHKEAALTKYKTNLDKATISQNNAISADEKAGRVVAVLTDRLSELRKERSSAKKMLIGKAAVSGDFGGSDASVAKADLAAARAGVRSRIAAYDAEIIKLNALRDAAENVKKVTSRNALSEKSNVTGIESDIRKVYNLKAAQDKLGEARKKLEDHTAALAKAEVTQKKLNQTTVQNKAALGEYSAAVQQISNEIQKLEAEERRLISSQKAATETTLAANDAIAKVNASAKQNGFAGMGADVAKVENRLRILEQRLQKTAELSSRLSRYSDGGGGFTTVDDAAKLRALNDKLAESKEDARQFRAELTKLKAELGTTTANSTRAKTEISSLATALNAAQTDARNLATAIRKVGIESGSQKAGLFETWRKYNAETRTALSLQQRIRGQVLSMIAAYGGLYSVVSLVREVTKAFMQQEAALSRLGVVFDGNQTRMGAELGWIRREAQRLGIEFGTLADEYTKFAVATKTSGFGDAATRKIFTSVSESARVNKLGLEDIKGIYLALSQMVSKSRITAEELRQQLGERLPGAMKLMANALKVSVSELDAMMKAGKAAASEENLIAFAEELDRQFGAQLPSALRMFTAELGRLQNTMYKSKLTIGEGGFIDALGEAIRKINEYAASKEGVTFFLALGKAMGDLVSYIPVLMENFEGIVKVIKVLVTIPIISFFTRWFAGLNTLRISLMASIATFRAAPLAIGTFVTSLRGSVGVAALASRAFVGLGSALLALGPIAAGLFVASTVFSAMGSWADGVDQITEAQAQHNRIMDVILTKYDEAKDKTYDWKDAVSDLSKAELSAQLSPNLDAVGAAIKQLQDIGAQRDKLTGSAITDIWNSTFGTIESDSSVIMSASEIADKFKIPPALLKELQDQWQSVMYNPAAATGEQLSQLRKTLLKFSEAVPDEAVKSKLFSISKAIDNVIGTSERFSLAATVVKQWGEKVLDATNIAARFPTSIEGAADGVNGLADEMSKFEREVSDKFIGPLELALREAGAFKEGFGGLDLQKTMTDPFTGATRTVGEMLTQLKLLKGFLPSIGSAFKEFAEGGSLDKLEAKLGWLQFIPALSGVLDKIMGQMTDASMGEKTEDFEKYSAMKGTGRGWMIRSYEGKINRAKQDTNEFGVPDKWRVGYGSDTVTDPATGKSRDTTSTDVITDAQAEADLARRIVRYISDITSKIGQERWDSFNSDQQEVLLSIAHNYGTIPNRIMEVVKTGSAEQIASAIRGEVKPGSVNNDRRRQEAAVFARGGNTSLEPYLKAEEGRIKDAETEAKKAAEDAEKAAKSKKDENASIAQGLVIEQMKVDGKEREAEIQEKINSYVEKHGALSQEELARLTEQYGKMYDLQNLGAKDEVTQKKIKEHQEEINRLESMRNSLLEQREIYSARGEDDKVKAVNEQLIGVNSNLSAAIDKFMLFWQTSNSPDAESTLASLQVMKEKLVDAGKEALLTAEQVNEKWAGGISNAFSSFAQAIAEGKDAMGAFRDSFLQFAGDFLVEIGKMIVQATVLKMLKSSGFGESIMGGLGAITSGVFHTGKAAGAGAGSMSRRVSPALFANAPRFHSGKLPGLRSGEMAAIIEKDEEVIPTSDARHSWNNSGSGGSGGGSQAPRPLKIVNRLSGRDVAAAIFEDGDGSEIIENYFRVNRDQLRGILGS